MGMHCSAKVEIPARRLPPQIAYRRSDANTEMHELAGCNDSREDSEPACEKWRIKTITVPNHSTTRQLVTITVNPVIEPIVVYAAHL